jgi:SAM-dependent methyltransferase|tara:strand:+ start:540 stop:1277 length:738 start_codon:yes stop_codon:yes gene_type:complete
MLHHYEKTQNFNFITKILHSVRYKNLIALVENIAGTKSGKLKIVDVGCGPAKSYQEIKKLGVDFSYVGVELREDFSTLASDRYSQFDNFQIINDSIENAFYTFNDADLIIGLETFEHIPEPILVRTMEAIGKSNFKYLYITVPNEIGPAIIIKNVGSFLMGYRRYKEYKWSETFAAGFYNLDSVMRHGTGHKGFDWRWLAQTVRQNCRIVKITKSPFQLVPKIISPSIGFICKNDIIASADERSV